VVTATDGRVVWNNDAYDFLGDGFEDVEAPASVHPSLWRQSILCAKQGLYEVVGGIYQVRGLDLSNITFVEGDISDRETMSRLADRHGDLDRIVHLAAQPGIRHSRIDPYVYVQTNVTGQLVLLELARRLYIDDLVYDTATLRRLIEVFGGDRVMAGTDYPFVIMDDDPAGSIEALAADPALRQALRAGNAQRWLGENP